MNKNNNITIILIFIVICLFFILIYLYNKNNNSYNKNIIPIQNFNQNINNNNINNNNINNNEINNNEINNNQINNNQIIIDEINIDTKGYENELMYIPNNLKEGTYISQFKEIDLSKIPISNNQITYNPQPKCSSNPLPYANINVKYLLSQK